MKSPVPRLPEEKALINCILAGDPAARNWLYDRYAPVLYGLVLQWTPSEHEARAALVDIFTHIFRNIVEYKQSNGILLLSWLMKQAREVTRREGIDQQFSRQSEGALIHFSNSLPEQCRQVFQLCYCTGWSRSAVAERLEIKEQQVHSLLQEAMIAFRKFCRNN